MQRLISLETFSRFLLTGALALCPASFASAQNASARTVDIARQDASAMGVQIDWPEFLGRHDPISEVLPTHFDSGPFLGNGMLGATIYKSGPKQLRFEIGRSDVTDRRFDNARLPIGGMVLKTVGTIESGTLRNDLWNAEVRGEIITSRGHIRIRAYVHAEEMALRVDLEMAHGESAAKLGWDPADVVVYRYEVPSIREAHADFVERVTPNPSPVLGSDGAIHYCEQERAGGGSFTTAWQLDGEGERRQLTLTVADSFPGLESRAQAVATVRRVLSLTAEALQKSHRAWWHAHYPASFVSVPDAQIEGFYWITMYTLASATRADRQLIDLMGPWYRSTMWPRVWWNFNIQNAYAPLYISNHLSLAESFTRLIDAKRDNFYRNARELWDVEDAATTPHNTCYEGLVGDGILPHRHMVNPGDFTWGLHLYWQHYLYSMDSSLVTDHEQHAFYPLLKASVNLYRHLLEEDEAGKLHLPVLLSPEYGHAANNSYNLSLLRWACQTLLHLNERYDLGDPLQEEWERILRDLVPYPTDANGFMVGEGVPFERSHRHWSHLLMIWPLHLFSIEDPENRELAVRSLKQWLTVDDSRGIQGWSQAAAASIYALMGDGQKAMESIRAHHNDTRSVKPSTRYIEGSPVIESGMMASRSLQDMLIQSWGERIRIFPAMPEEWQDAAFHDFRAKGAFLVSAVRQDGKTRWVRIRSLAGEPCLVRPGFDTSFSVWPASIQLQETAPGEFEIPLAKGQEVILYVGDVNDLPAVAPSELPPGSHNFWGVKDRN